MGYEPCRSCGEWRKFDDYGTVEDGPHVPACQHCGDPDYHEQPWPGEEADSWGEAEWDAFWKQRDEMLKERLKLKQ